MEWGAVINVLAAMNKIGVVMKIMFFHVMLPSTYQRKIVSKCIHYLLDALFQLILARKCMHFLQNRVCRLNLAGNA